METLKQERMFGIIKTKDREVRLSLRKCAIVQLERVCPMRNEHGYGFADGGKTGERRNNRPNEPHSARHNSDCCAGQHAEHNAQLDRFVGTIMKNDVLREIFVRAPSLGLHDYYIGAGCLVQTVWNDLCGFPLSHGIRDIDFVYFDNRDVSFDAEDRCIRKVQRLFADLPVQIDVKNQARVHLWYERHFGYSISPYVSLEAAINTWPTTSTAIGARRDARGRWTVYAPFGLDDVFGMVIRPNKAQITKEIYDRKVARWRALWPALTIVPWD